MSRPTQILFEIEYSSSLHCSHVLVASCTPVNFSYRVHKALLMHSLVQLRISQQTPVVLQNSNCKKAWCKKIYWDQTCAMPSEMYVRKASLAFWSWEKISTCSDASWARSKMMSSRFTKPSSHFGNQKEENPKMNRLE